MALSECDRQYLKSLYDARDALVLGKVKAYSLGSRSLTYLDLATINTEIARLEGASRMRIRRVIPID